MNAGDTERKKQKLIDLGKSKGFLTYDEVNDNMPEDIVSSDQIDDWLSALGDEGIEIVDSASKVRVSSKVPTPKVADAIEEDEKEEETEDEDYDSGYTKSNDPVRMYLRKMGSVSLLTREGEVEIARRIEQGENKIFEVILNSRVGVNEIIEIGERLKRGKLRPKDVVKEREEETLSEEEQRARIVRFIEKVKRLESSVGKLKEDMSQVKKPQDRRAAQRQIEHNRRERIEALRELELNKKTIDKIVSTIKGYIRRVERAEQAIIECEQRAAVEDEKDLKKLLKDV